MHNCKRRKICIQSKKKKKIVIPMEMDDYIAKSIFLVVFLMISSSPTSSAFPIAKPGCEDQDHCGDVSIPFPFGTRESCFLSQEFWVSCTSSNDGGLPQAFLKDSTIMVKDLSLGCQLRVLYDVGYDCYDQNKTSVDYFSPWMDILGFMYFNSTVNKFTAIGCDTYAIVKGISNERNYTTGCMSICGGREDVEDGPCSGIGCCQTSIPNGARQINVTLNSYDNHASVWDFNPCSYAFVIEEAAFEFYADNLTNIGKNLSVPVVLDWVVGYEACEVAKKNLSSYACKGENSLCLDLDGARGYRCICKEGFEGNPYLPNGCQDIDECANPSLYSCAKYSTCANTLGSYACECNEGYHGDGRSGGEGCIGYNNYWSIVAAGIPGMLFLIIAICTSYKMLQKWRKKRRKEKFFKQNGGLLLQQQLLGVEGFVEKAKIFSAKELHRASDGFNVNRVLGEGGQGTVYKGMLTDGRIVAIKKSKKVDKSYLEQFINEVFILSQVNHRNVVKMLGCCLETEVPLLVYEFTPNGTLFNLIHNGNDQEFPLTWSIRLRIAMEVANALAYLHSSLSLPIFHKDVKSSNILLNEKYTAKVSDFGTSRSVAIDKTHLTTRVQGTFGYIDPEYFQSSQFTDKSDVYSFGVVLIELLTRQKPISAGRGEDNDLGLARRFLETMEKNSLKTILDPEIFDEKNEEEVIEIIEVAKLAQRCLILNGRRRPTMREAAMKLESIKMSKQDSNIQPNSPSCLSYIEEEFGYTETTESESIMSPSHTIQVLYDTI